MRGKDAAIVVVDDDQGCRALHRQWLADEHDVETAADGEQALSAVDESVDLVVLDREMPGLTGDEVARRLDDRGFEGFVVMVTGVEPDFDLVDLPIDDYLVKPVTEDALLSAVTELQSRKGYHDQLKDLFSLSAKKARLEVEKSRLELARSDEYERLNARIDDHRAALTERLTDVENSDDWATAFEACTAAPVSTD